MGNDCQGLERVDNEGYCSIVTEAEGKLRPVVYPYCRVNNSELAVS